VRGAFVDLVDSFQSEHEKIRIIGAGFSGLTLAYYLKKINPLLEITIQDEATRVGGLLESVQTSYGLVETAANAILEGEEVSKLAQDLDLEMIKANKGIKKAYFLTHAKLRSWPLTIKESFSLIPRVFRFFLNKNSFSPEDFESVEQWGQRNLGMPFTQKLLDAALAGIYASRVQDLSARLIFSRFFKFQKKSLFKKRKKKKGLRSTAPRLGMQHLCVRLEEWLRKQNVEFVLGQKFNIEDKKENEKLIFCGSLTAAQNFFKEFLPLQENYKEFFSLPSLPVSKTTLFFDSKVSSESPKAFGVLFPRLEKRPFLGVLLDTKIFSRENEYYSESWISNETFSDLKAAQEKILKERSFVFKSKSPSLSGHCKSWQKALPLYGDQLNRFLLDRWPLMRRDLAKSGIYVHGNYLGHLGLSRLLLESKNMALTWQVKKK
jgi:oxygen-dependent protoporphyrinogen oxidase